MTKEKMGISSLGIVGTFMRKGSWAETLTRVVDLSFDNPLELEEHAANPLMGGLMNHGYQCGMLWGAALAAGAQAYQLHGPGPQAETQAILAAQRIIESFLARYNHINCLEITDITTINTQGKIQILKLLKFLIKGGPIGCLNMAVKSSRAAFDAINTALSETHIEAPSPPVSCVALLAQKMGASDMHTVMAAGLAGGIGLSGGACGALGAAMWINGMNSIKEGADNKILYSRASDMVDKFIRSTNFELECSEIVGRKFESIDDHAGYLRDGGCSEIIELLAAKSSEG